MVFRPAILAVVVAVIALAAVSGPTGSMRVAHASVLTPAHCDPDPKYYCSRVEFDRVTGGFIIRTYQHRGATDGGAQRWQRNYVQESAYPSGTFLHNVPETSWSTNEFLPSSYTSVSRGVTYYQHINVHFGFQYYECTPDAGCYYWWGDTDQIMLAV
jgi:hypothetical protein